ncbi:MAG: ABC transporter permease [Hyphomicrobiaceae bacterium]|nr:MAG: ABC transporter permease [Hyphomicrobiaceae bacterium]
MLAYLIRRLMQSVVTVAVMSAIVFIGVSVVGDPVESLVGPQADQAERERIIRDFGLDRPVYEQYGRFVAGIVSGNFGVSFKHGEPAIKMILERMPATMELAFAALLMAIFIGIPLGLYAGLRPESGLAKLIMAGSIVGFSLPTFWVGLMLMMVFAVMLGWLPSIGRGETATYLGITSSFFTLDGLQHLVLPAVNLALLKISLVIRLVRAGASEAIRQDYVKFARAKGLKESRVVGVHLLKNIMIPVLTVIGLEFGGLVAFSVVTETIFAWPGMGRFLIKSIEDLDRPVVVAYLVIIVLLFVLINLIVDLLYSLFDPRVRAAGRAT